MFSIYSNSGNTSYGVKEFMLDSESDLSSLPTDCAAGSVAYIIDSSLTYTLNNSKEWKKVTFSTRGSTGQKTSESQGSSGESGDTPEEITEEGNVWEPLG